MRMIGHIEKEDAARVLSDFLFVQGIDNQVERDGGHGWAVWIHSEDHIEKARSWLAGFLQDPNAGPFKQGAAQAEKLRQQRDKEAAAFAKKVRPRAETVRTLAHSGFGPLTMALIAISILVFALTDLAKDPRWVRLLSLSGWSGGLAAVLHGELWRLLTPIFIHFSLLHIFFNMLWLRDLGGMIESQQGSLRLGLLVTGIAVASNLAQYFVNLSVPSSGVFGGMSGVVYGLVGYIWMRGKFDPGSGLFLHPYTVGMMIVWAVLCLTGLLGDIANTVHFVGLGVGMAWGYLSSLRYR
jgi:GlpG protein